MALAAVLGSFSVVLVSVVLIVVYIAATQPKVKATCDTSDCKDHVSALGLSRIHGADPCEDFGRFVCSGWMHKYKRITQTLVHDVLADWLYRIAELTSSKAGASAASNKAQQMMIACATKADDYASSLSSLKSFMVALGFAWPENEFHIGPDEYAKFLQLLIELDVNWALPLWFHIERHDTFGSRGRTFVVSSSFMASVWQYFNKKLLDYRGAYDWYLHLFEICLFRDDLSVHGSFHYFLKDSADVQSAILGALGNADKSSVYRPQLIRLGGTPAIASKLTPVMWMDVLREVYGSDAPVMVGDFLVATNERLMAAIEELFVAFSAQTLWFHTTWWFVQSVGTFSSNVLPATVAAVDFGNLGSVLNTVCCVLQVELTYNTLLAAITKSQFTEDEVREIPRYFHRIKTLAIEKISSSDRMNDTTKSTLLNVLKETATAIWPEGVLRSQGSFDRLYGAVDNDSRDFFSQWYSARLALQKSRGSSLYEEAVKTYRVSNNRLFEYKYIPNAVSASTASVHPPLYYSNGTSAMIYGGIGFLFAKELVDALNFMILRPIPNETTWGANSTWRLWEAFSCPAADDREQVVFPMLPALDIAYSAYKRFRDPMKDLPLQGLDSYTPEQIFFLTFCHTMCRIEVLTGAQYSPDCSVAVRNFEPFARAFSCSPGSKMHPINKCRYF
ncbi:membrane metallo-endopeptidase-like 1 [Dermacentor variabilis]|uniref:membrane metallo-endopeptidase-like 1 n=1 Tax=Dermacentor variabilis TaxID=34621 RepID=UPI003F5C6B30